MPVARLGVAEGLAPGFDLLGETTETAQLRRWEPRGRWSRVIGTAKGVVTKPPGVLTWPKRIAAGIVVVQLAFLVAWSIVEWNRFSLTYDFFVYFRSFHAFWVNGLNPFNLAVDHLSLANNGTVIVWPLAVLTSVYPHGIDLLVIQDLAIVAAEVVALRWMAEALEGSGLALSQPRLTRSLFGLGLVLLVADPWIYWASSDDFHIEAIAVLFALLATRELMRRRWGRMALWVILTLSCGYVAGTYVVGIAITALIVGGGRRLVGLGLLAGGALLVLVAVLDQHLSGGFTAQLAGEYGYLAGGGAGVAGVGSLVGGALSHPERIANIVWSRRLELMANLAPAGLLGIVSPWVLGVGIVALFPTLLNHYVQFVEPSFQSLTIYIFVPVGTVLVLVFLARRARRGLAVAWAMTVLLALETIGWAVIWLPRLPGAWLQVAPNSATVLARVDAQMPIDAQVVASQGIVGRFGDRRSVDAIFGPGAEPVGKGPVWFVIAPQSGIENETSAAASADVAYLADDLHAQLMDSGAGVWAFRWNPPAGVRSVDLPGATGRIPAWTLAPGNAGTVDTSGPVASWDLTSTGSTGYVFDQAEWSEPSGQYAATIRLSASGPVRMSVCDATTGVRLAIRTISATNGVATVSMDAFSDQRNVTLQARTIAANGQPVPEHTADQLEVRLWSPGQVTVNVVSVGIARVGGLSS